MHPRSIRPALCTCLLASSLLLFSTPAAVAKSIAKDDINVRSGPSTGDEILFTVPRGYPIQVERRSGQWTQFRDWQNNTAWVYTPLVSDINTAVITAATMRGAEFVGEHGVGHLGLLQAHHIGGALVEPGQQPRGPLLHRVHIPGRQAHARTLLAGMPRGWCPCLSSLP